MLTEKKSITLDGDIIKKVADLAKKDGRSFSNMVQRILEKHFKKGKLRKITQV